MNYLSKVLAVLGLGVVALWIFFPTEQPRLPATTIVGMSHAKTCARAMDAYLNDNNDVFPVGSAEAMVDQALRPYIRDDERSFFWNTQNPNHKGHFAFNFCLAGASSSVVPEPEMTPAFFDRYARRNTYGYYDFGWKFLSSFVDGHTQYVRQKKWDPMKANLTLVLPRQGKPPKEIAVMPH